MPTYTYKCISCDATFERVVSFERAKDPQACACGQQAERTLAGMNFLLKGDDWAGKNIKIRGQMDNKNRVLDAKQAEQKRHFQSMQLAPNVDGERVDTWADAKKLASERGKATSTYDTLVQREQGAA